MIEWKSIKEDGFPKNKGKYLTCGNRSIFGDYVSYDVLGFSLDLNSIDEYDFPKEKYKNKPGFFYYDSEYGFGEYTHVLFWAPINSPDEKIVDEGEEKQMMYKALFTDEFLSHFRLDDNGRTLVLTDKTGLTRAVRLEEVKIRERKENG